MTYISTRGRQQRSFAGKAPKLSDDYYEPAAPVKTIFKNSQPAEWKPDDYSRQLFGACFKKW
ncbi:hypothetical protein [Salinicoccus sp. HZC-1]|uniref:hypothetical protein n=1 Tax=Salinicoccus sp. HZC-1 TaxID=3385497 RepID=UPI00398A7040